MSKILVSKIGIGLLYLLCLRIKLIEAQACTDASTIFCMANSNKCFSNTYFNGQKISSLCPLTCKLCATTVRTTTTLILCRDTSDACTKVPVSACTNTSITIQGVSVANFCRLKCGRCTTTTTTTRTTTTRSTQSKLSIVIFQLRN